MVTTKVRKHLRNQNGRTVPVREHNRYYVDTDFGTRSRNKNGVLDGRDEVSGQGDRVAVIRDQQGHIVGRAKQFDINPKTKKMIIPRKTDIHIKGKTIHDVDVKEVGR